MVALWFILDNILNVFLKALGKSERPSKNIFWKILPTMRIILMIMVMMMMVMMIRTIMMNVTMRIMMIMSIMLMMMLVMMKASVQDRTCN